jgi:hypothetical protein
MSKILIFFLVLCLSAVCAKAETTSALSGLKQFQLLVEDLSQSDPKCGITEDLVRRALMDSVASQKFKIVDKSTVAFYVKIATLHTANGICMSVTNVDLRAAQNVQLAFSGAEHFVRVLLWSNAWFDTSPGGNAHKKQIRKTLEEASQQFIDDWQSANK